MTSLKSINPAKAVNVECYYLTLLSNVKDGHYCYDVNTSERYYRWSVVVSGNGPIMALTDLGHVGQYIVDNRLVYARGDALKDATSARALPQYAPYTAKREFLQGFAGQFVRVMYRGEDGVKRLRTVKALKRSATHVLNNPLCFRVYDASVKGIRTIRLDRLLGVKMKGVEVNF